MLFNHIEGLLELRYGEVFCLAECCEISESHSVWGGAETVQSFVVFFIIKISTKIMILNQRKLFPINVFDVSGGEIFFFKFFSSISQTKIFTHNTLF